MTFLQCKDFYSLGVGRYAKMSAILELGVTCIIWKCVGQATSPACLLLDSCYILHYPPLPFFNPSGLTSLLLHTMHALASTSHRIYSRNLFFSSALIFVSHGVGEHCSRYEEFAHVLAKQGFLVISHDHGKIKSS